VEDECRAIGLAETERDHEAGFKVVGMDGLGGEDWALELAECRINVAL
jgi:hypothetical protein